MYSLIVTVIIIAASSFSTLLIPQIEAVSRPDYALVQFETNPSFILSDSVNFDITERQKSNYSLKSADLNSSFTLCANSFLNEKIKYDFKVKIKDSDGDAFPDLCELYGEDVVSFRNWFIALAIDQKLNHSDLWKERDCSGLVRFAYREALKSHDSTWIDKSGVSGIYTEDVTAFNYPDIPIIGEKLFYDGKEFVGFADARHLLLYNTEKVSRELNEEVKKGDIAFFYHPQDIQYPYHVMIYTGNGFIYHTGPTDEDEGYLRLWYYEDYLNAAPLTWQPVKENPDFLGFYKFKILND